MRISCSVRAVLPFAVALAGCAGVVSSQSTRPNDDAGKVNQAKVNQARVNQAKIIKNAKRVGQSKLGPSVSKQGAPKRRPFDGPRPNRWFEVTQLDLGTRLEGETAKGQFRFKNPDQTEHVLRNISPNCQCARAKIVIGERTYVIENHPVPNTIYRLDGPEDPKEATTNRTPKTKVKHIAVGAGESGYVEMHLDLKGITGVKEAFIAMRTDDPLLPSPRVVARVRGVKFFTVQPPQVNLNKMTWDQRREFSFEVTSDIKPEFEVTDVTTAAEALVVTSKVKTSRNGKTVWTIAGQYGPDVKPRAGGGVLKVLTNVRGAKGGPSKSVDVRVIAVVDGPMTVRPGTFLPLGRVRQKNGTIKVVEFEPNNDFDLQFAEVTFENVTVGYEKFLRFKTSKDGKILKLELEVAPNAPSGLVRGDVKVGLNHPAIPHKSLQFNGFVR